MKQTSSFIPGERLNLSCKLVKCYSIRMCQFHPFSIPLVNCNVCKSCVMIPRQHCHPPSPNRRLNTFTVGPWHSHTFSLPRVNHRDRCIYSNTTPPSPGVHHKGPRHVVIRQMLQLHPHILMVDHGTCLNIFFWYKFQKFFF